MWAKESPSWDDVFPSEVIRAANRLERRGWATKEITANGLQIKITDKGRTEVLKYDIENWEPKKEKWDNKWRMVFFDVEEKRRRKRVELIHYLKSLGLQEFQKSVYITPFDVEKEIRYLREVLEIPNNIKFCVAEKVDNEQELRDIWGL